MSGMGVGVHLRSANRGNTKLRSDRPGVKLFITNITHDMKLHNYASTACAGTNLKNDGLHNPPPVYKVTT